mmetsp:Transcript_10416/g.18792  ORF Transcript_10416/g.18792 Transcript_10416/m.18792 type:complete len:180 (-) Transcript_10416:294-833(-)|eukprot:CAMPEP_0182442180 /NCGR_PEP_ID=MMETSP1172-20130603/1124_1 /TAXON_ID=708627 /ORGANISM="Timspurckia oligopyrenoides, Strain CCMP3278" /LENGTH=179 /DNA_ID=CAMNT_0024636905 /DNA_START=202 /DNA_END=741 /DNA_ORIENTATION=-
MSSFTSCFVMTPGVISSGVQNSNLFVCSKVPRQVTGFCHTNKVVVSTGRQHVHLVMNGSSSDENSSNLNDASSRNWDEKDMHKIPKSSVDWNSEWNRFASSGMKTEAGKGRSPTPKFILNAKRTLNSAKASVVNAKQNAPTFRQLSNDWKFWVAIIVALSVFSASVNYSQSQQYIVPTI